MKLSLFLLAVGAIAGTLVAGSNPVVVMETSMGTITLELYPDKAPKTVENFLRYVKEGYFDNTLFHRVMSGFMIQGGGFNLKGVEKPSHAPIPNEADNKVSNARGMISMARTNDPNSASSQFFINLVDNTGLNFKSKANGGTWGYCAFGKVIKGMDVVDAIAKVKTGSHGPYQDWPVDKVFIKKTSLKKAK